MTTIDTAASSKPLLPNVTLCAVSSSNVSATVRALEASLDQVEFADALLFTDADLAALGISASPKITTVEIEAIRSSAQYSQFVLEKLVDHIRTDYCLIAQWDGHVIDGARWREEFLDFDYVGASWPQFDDKMQVGNGGFSLRSRQLMEACRDERFQPHNPEDIAVCRTNRPYLEGIGMRFAPVEVADRFAAERSGDPETSFGFHGAFLMPQVLGTDQFWAVYRKLDDRTSLWRDLPVVAGAMLRGNLGLFRAAALALGWLRSLAFTSSVQGRSSNQNSEV